MLRPVPLQVCDQIMQRLHDQCVVMLSQDSFYRGLTPEESRNAKGALRRLGIAEQADCNHAVITH